MLLRVKSDTVSDLMEAWLDVCNRGDSSDEDDDTPAKPVGPEYVTVDQWNEMSKEMQKNVWFSQQRASEYIRVAQNWSICKDALQITDALRLLTDDVDDEEDDSPTAPPSTPSLTCCR